MSRLVLNTPLPPDSIPTNNYLFKINNRNIRKRCEAYSKLTITDSQYIFFGVLFLTLNMYLFVWLLDFLVKNILEGVQIPLP